MSTSFTKLFSSITESTIWCEDTPVRIVWITMLAMADRHGRVWASLPGLANRARVSLSEASIAIEKFLSPDQFSRTPANDGRRIEVIDGGWRLLNHAKYRAIRDEESILESKRKYINARRARESKPVRDAIEKRDGAICGLCAKTVDVVNCEIDHILPKIDGGEPHISNLQFAHRACNLRKHAAKSGQVLRHHSMPKIDVEGVDRGRANAEADSDSDSDTSGSKGKALGRIQYSPSEAVKAWALEKGYGATYTVHLEYFIDYVTGSDNKKKYKDFDAAFRNCLRADWGGIRAQAMRGQQGAFRQPQVDYGICKFCPKKAIGKSKNGVPHCDTARHIDNANGR